MISVVESAISTASSSISFALPISLATACWYSLQQSRDILESLLEFLVAIGDHRQRILDKLQARLCAGGHRLVGVEDKRIDQATTA